MNNKPKESSFTEQIHGYPSPFVLGFFSVASASVTETFHSAVCNSEVTCVVITTCSYW